MEILIIGNVIVLGFAIFSMAWMTNSHLDRIEERLTKKIEKLLEDRETL